MKCKDVKKHAQAKIIDIENKIIQLQAMKKALTQLTINNQQYLSETLTFRNQKV